MVTDDDWALVQAWQGGDKSAGELLFERHADFLKGFLRRRLSNPNDVDDLAIETMIAWMRRPPTPRSGTSFRSVLVGVAMNVLRRHIRKTVKRERERGDFTAICFKDQALENSLASKISPAARVLVRALFELPQEQQVVLALAYLEDLTAPEIAQSLDIPVPTVYTRLRRGRQKLRAAMAECGESPERIDREIPTIRTWARGVVEGFTPRRTS